MSEEFAELKIKDTIYKLPIKKSTIGSDVIDITQLYKNTGYFTYDPGFMSTASCSSAITFIDGNQGILRHRGYDIQNLAKNRSFLEISYLLLNGELPNKTKYEHFKSKISYHSLVNEQMRNIFGAFRHSAHPMAIMLSAVGSLSAFYHDKIDMKTSEGRESAAIRMIAKMPTIAAMVYKHSISQAFVYPNEEFSFTENFLYMLLSTPSKKYIPNPTLTKALDKIFILHADHEQNASTSTVRTCGSSGPDPFACIASGIASLWGPAHGGANEAVIDMLTQIGSVKNIPSFIKRAKDKNDPFRLMGFGHRVYKNYDPRATILRETSKEILSELGARRNNHILDIAMELEKIALNDQYFIEKKLYPNIDFYSGIIYQAMGIPTQMFTVLFVLARTSGWVAQWLEMWQDPEFKIARPRQLYNGHISR